MKHLVLLIFCVFVLFATKISAKYASCEYDEAENLIYFAKNIQYACGLSFDDAGRYPKISSIGGSHNEDKDDDDVQAVHINLEDSSILELTTVVCKKFENLEYLNVLGLKIKSINDDAFQKCQNLKLLFFDNNKLRKIPANLLSNNKQLIDFKITSNEIKSLSEDTFKMQENLKRLDLSNNKIENLPADVFKSLTSLEMLDLSDNQISELNIEWFKSLKKLKKLSMNKNKIDDLPMNIFGNLRNLNMLEMNYNQLTEIHADSFANTGSLRGLKFDFNKIRSVDRKLTHNYPIGVLHMTKNSCFNGQLNTRDRSMDEKLKRCYKSHEQSKHCFFEKIQLFRTSRCI